MSKESRFDKIFAILLISVVLLSIPFVAIMDLWALVTAGGVSGKVPEAEARFTRIVVISGIAGSVVTLIVSGYFAIKCWLSGKRVAWITLLGLLLYSFFSLGALTLAGFFS